MFTLMVTGIVLWLIHGFLMMNLPLVLANAVTLVLVGAILWLKLRHFRSVHWPPHEVNLKLKEEIFYT